MKCAKDYQAVISADGRLAFVIPAGKDEPHSPKLIYNGGESALLYRSAADILVLDKLHESAFCASSCSCLLYTSDAADDA